MKAATYLAGRLGGCMLSALCMGLSLSQAFALDLLETSYEVNVKGVTVLDVKYSAAMSAAGFRSQASVKTRGVAAFLSDYLMEIETSGALVEGRAGPQHFTSRREKNNKIREIELTWSDGILATSGFKSNKDPDIQAEIDKALTPNVADLLTAIMRIGLPQGAGPCQSIERIFDGREVFELHFKLKGKVSIDEGSAAVYYGPAYECLMTYVPVAGRYAKKFRSRNDEPPSYKVWFAPVGREESGRPVFVPIQASGKLDGLKFVALAKRIKIDGQPFNKVSLN
jgi:hypothetical protein